MALDRFRASLRRAAQSETHSRQKSRLIGSLAGKSILAGVIIALVLIPATSLVAVTTNRLANDVIDLPLTLKDQPNAQTTRLMASDGKTLIAYFYKENRQDVPLKDIAPVMQDALLAIEDNRFYEHGALDLKGTLRALVNNASEGQTQGGSSITQQLVKLTLVSQATTKEQVAAATKKSTSRKIRELKLAIAYEEKHTKKEILERYLNLAYFGDGAYGVYAAANHYFSKKPSELNARQAATLAGLVKNPVEFDPNVYPEKALQRRNTVLAVMANQGKISRADADKYQSAALALKITKFNNGCVASAAEFSCDYVQRWLLKQPALGNTRQARLDKLQRGGLTIRSNINLRVQEATDNAVEDTVQATDEAVAALASVEPGTGKVRAISQSRPMGNSRKKGETYLNFVVPKRYGGATGFPAGSTFKLFTVTAALKNGIGPEQTFNSPPSLTMKGGSYVTCDGLNVTDEWKVDNSTTSGSKNMYTGTRQSVNTYFAQLEKKAGLCNVVRAAEAMGITVLKDQQVGPFTLGVTDVSPLDMAAAYATFASGGQYCAPRPVKEILDANNKVIKKYKPNCTKVMTDGQAAQINDILRGVQEPGGFGFQNGTGLDIPSAAKTGTTQGNQAVWYAGYTPDLSTASMIAGVITSKDPTKNGNPKSLVGVKINGRLLDFGSVGGSSLAGPMWAKAMQKIQTYLSPVNFETPPARQPVARAPARKKSDD